MKYTIDDVRKIFALKGYELLEDNWKNKTVPMLSRCICGNECYFSLKAVNRGSKCKECSLESAGKSRGFAGRLKKTTEEVALFFKKNGCELLDEYNGCQKPMTFKCSCGNISKIRWDHFKNGSRCSKCKRGIKTSIEEIKKIFAENNCEVLSEDYTHSKQKIKYRCKCGRVSECLFTTMKYQKNHCKECGKEKNRGENASWYIKDRESLNHKNKFKKRCYKILEHTLNMTGKKKEGHTYDLLGYSPKDLQNYIESHPNWESVKNEKWHLDHIFPIHAFLEHEITDVKLINSLDNLQPLLAKENSKKNNKYDKDLFLVWLQIKGI